MASLPLAETRATEADHRGRARSTRSRPLVVAGAMALLLAVYVVLSLANDPRGTLGTDTGGKLATLAVMEQRGTLDPDVGYWAADLDPEGTLHPLYYTSRLGDRWINVTTLPMVLAAAPLHAVGGPRAVLALPMLGAALAALAARALAQRLGSRDGWWAFWTVGLASPIAVYALDFWEHAPGVALVLWGMVFLVDLVDARAGWRGALASGLCFGGAAMMRTESLVYAAVAAAVTAVLIARRAARVGEPPVRWMIAVGGAWAAGAAGVLVANQALEREVLGESLRAARAARTAGAAGADANLRVKEALTTGVGLNRLDTPADWIVGAFVVVLVMYAAWRLLVAGPRHRVAGVTALLVAGLCYGLRFEAELGFVPGMLSASPLAAAGSAVGWTVRRWRPVGTVALVAVPVVWLFQYSGGAHPQWAGRYLLVSSTLLAVGAAIVIATAPGAGRVAVVALAAVVTAAGVASLSERSATIADAGRALRTDAHTVLISREAHLLREIGAFYDPDRHWLTAERARDLRRAVAIADEVGAARLEVAAWPDRASPSRLGAFSRTGVRSFELLPGLDVELTRYRRLVNDAP